MKNNIIKIIALILLPCHLMADDSDLELRKRISILEAKIEKLTNILDQKNNIISDDSKEVKISMKPSPKFETLDGNYKFGLGGYLQTDYIHFTKNKGNNLDGAYIRNARLSMNGSIDKNWFYTIENNFKGNKSKLTTALLSYNFYNNNSVTVGQFNEKFGFENSSSGKTTTFIEPAYLSVFAPSRKLGIGFNSYRDNWTANIGINSNSEAYVNDNSDRFRTISSRLSYNPLFNQDNIIHIGVSSIVGKPKSSRAAYVISAKPDSDIARDLISSGNITNINRIKISGIETMIRHKSISLQSEYAINHITRNNMPKDSHKAAYAQIAWTITGEARIYDKINGNFGGINPYKPLTSASTGIGAWEVAARYNYIKIDHNSANLRPSDVKNIGLALNWYPNNYIRFMTNYIIVRSKNNQSITKANPNILMLRAQFGF